MAYLRTRNGYGYVCKKVKKEGQWKEETIIGLGKITEENKERMKWIAETGMELELTNDEELLNDLREELGDRAKGKELEIKREWSYPEDNKTREEIEAAEHRVELVKVVGYWYSTDEERNKIIATPVTCICS